MLSLLSDGFDRFQWLVLDVFGSFFDSSVNTEKFISSQVGFFGSSVNTEEKKIGILLLEHQIILRFQILVKATLRE